MKRNETKKDFDPCVIEIENKHNGRRNCKRL